MSDQQPYRSRAGQRRRKKQRNTLIVLVVLILAMLGLALLLSGIGAEKPPASSAPSAPSLPPSAPPSSAPPPSSAAPPASSSQPPEPLGPYDEEGRPPLYNANNYIPEGHALDLIDVGGGQQMDRRAGEAFIAMYQAAAQDGIDLAPVSGYRSHERQTSNFNGALQRNRDKGLSEDEAYAATRRYYAIPGTSEHEAGLAMDIGWIEDSFEGSAAFAWLQEHCNDYGFIFRYRADTEAITGIAYEPWHYRYVGANHAKAIEAAGLTLEEYIDSLNNS